jgi:hypothetical protein
MRKIGAEMVTNMPEVLAWFRVKLFFSYKVMRGYLPTKCRYILIV